jgi:tRNA A37 threonylcarbamoyladenosine synthetase subunit TsaC/SUA5/YrdC
MTKYILDFSPMGIIEMHDVMKILKTIISEGEHGSFKGSTVINFDDETGQVWRSGFKNK